MTKILSNSDVGFKLRMLRQKAGLTQEQLAESIGVSPYQIRKYEAGRDNISIEKLQQLADLFSVTVQEFFTEAGEAIPLQVSERALLDAFRSIESPDIQESILKLTINAAKIKNDVE